MKAHVRRAAAYVAQRLISDASNSAIYDYAGARFSKYGGTCSRDEVMVFDNDRSCYIAGKPAGRRFSLFDFGESSRWTLEINGTSFQGFDYQSSRRFSGIVEGRLIRLFDHEDHAHHTFGF